MEVLEARTKTFRDHDFFEFLRDTKVDPRQRLAFVPCVAHFVMTFADLYALFREDSPKDYYQELVNAHTLEDGDHWMWFLGDLEKLDLNPRIPFSEAIRFIWSKDLSRQRQMSYEIFRMGLGDDSLRKLVLVQCIEATGKVSLESASQVGRQFHEATGKRLVYFGPYHFDNEADHTLEDDNVRGLLMDIKLEDKQAEEYIRSVNKCFDLFTAFTAELHRFVKEKGPFALDPLGKR
jgi:hypothetical protein